MTSKEQAAATLAQRKRELADAQEALVAAKAHNTEAARLLYLASEKHTAARHAAHAAQFAADELGPTATVRYSTGAREAFAIVKQTAATITARRAGDHEGGYKLKFRLDPGTGKWLQYPAPKGSFSRPKPVVLELS